MYDEKYLQEKGAYIDLKFGKGTGDEYLRIVTNSGADAGEEYLKIITSKKYDETRGEYMKVGQIVDDNPISGTYLSVFGPKRKQKVQEQGAYFHLM